MTIEAGCSPAVFDAAVAIRPAGPIRRADEIRLQPAARALVHQPAWTKTIRTVEIAVSVADCVAAVKSVPIAPIGDVAPVEGPAMDANAASAGNWYDQADLHAVPWVCMCDSGKQ